MALGGRRPGAGRKPGSATKRTREIAERASSEGITPLEVMIKAMRNADAEGNAREAAYYANMAAPYVHPRLASINAQQTVQGQLQVTVISEFPT